MLIDEAILFIPASTVKKEKLKTYTEKRMWVLKHQDTFPVPIEVTKHPEVTDAFITEYAPLCTDEIAKEYDVSLNDIKASAIAAFNYINPEYKISVQKYRSPDYPADTVQILDTITQELVNVFGLNILFKGGYILSKLVGNDARISHDIDFDINTISTYDQVKVVLKFIGDKLISENKIGSYHIKDKIEPTVSGGIEFYDKYKKKILGVDVGLHPTNYGAVYFKIKEQKLKIYTVERMLCDKIKAVLSKSRYHRVKDFYDIYIITQHFDFDMYKLKECINIRTDGEGLDWLDYPYTPEDVTRLSNAYTRMCDDSLKRFGHDLVGVDFKTLLDRLDRLCRPLQYNINYSYWSCSKGDFVK